MEDEEDDNLVISRENETISTSRRGARRCFTLSSIALVCISHGFSAWGDRMWAFAVGLYLVELTPGSLMLTAIYSLVVLLTLIFFGPFVGDWVDKNPRLKVAQSSLVAQNLTVVFCAVMLLVILMFKDSLSQELYMFLEAIVIMSAAFAELPSMATNVAVVKDWVVVICDSDSSKLAETNAIMKRIDLSCKILAPVLVGQIMTYVSKKAGVIFIAGWNALSLFLEYYILWRVYVSVPALSHKISKTDQDESAPHVDPRLVVESESLEQEEGEQHSVCHASSSEHLMEDPEVLVRSDIPLTSLSIITRLKNKISTFKTGWQVYMRQSVARPGICLAMYYFTVLDFSNIATGYAYTQHLSESVLSILRAVGALFGISATFVYPRMRRKVGLVRTGLFSTVIQFACMTICLVGVFAPGSPFFVLHLNSRQTSSDHSQLSPVCVSVSSSTAPSTTINNSSAKVSYSQHSFKESRIQATPASVSVSSSTALSTSMNISSTKVSYSQHSFKELRIQATPALPTTPRNVSNHSSAEPDQATAVGLSSKSLSTLVLSTVNSTIKPFSSGCYNTTVAPRTTAKHSYISIVLILTGIILYRLGLWMSDLTVTQFQQETIPVEERGIVGGMQNSFNAFANLLIIILVIVFHTPQQFGILTILSVLMVGLAGLLYASFAYRERGHLFHFDRLKNLSSCLRNGEVARHTGEWQPLSDQEEEEEEEEEEDNYPCSTLAEDKETDSIRNENFGQ